MISFWIIKHILADICHIYGCMAFRKFSNNWK